MHLITLHVKPTQTQDSKKQTIKCIIHGFENKLLTASLLVIVQAVTETLPPVILKPPPCQDKLRKFVHI